MEMSEHEQWIKEHPEWSPENLKLLVEKSVKEQGEIFMGNQNAKNKFYERLEKLFK
jgi:hypothetical protein